MDLICFPVVVDLTSLQHRTTWMTALHIATRRAFPITVTNLLTLGADMNAVAEGDLMPLLLADRIDDGLECKADIIAALERRYCLSRLTCLLKCIDLLSMASY